MKNNAQPLCGVGLERRDNFSLISATIACTFQLHV
jgi:hypothetical protein